VKILHESLCQNRRTLPLTRLEGTSSVLHLQYFHDRVYRSADCTVDFGVQSLSQRCKADVSRRSGNTTLWRSFYHIDKLIISVLLTDSLNNTGVRLFFIILIRRRSPCKILVVVIHHFSSRRSCPVSVNYRFVLPLICQPIGATYTLFCSMSKTHSFLYHSQLRRCLLMFSSVR